MLLCIRSIDFHILQRLIKKNNSVRKSIKDSSMDFKNFLPLGENVGTSSVHYHVNCLQTFISKQDKWMFKNKKYDKKHSFLKLITINGNIWKKQLQIHISCIWSIEFSTHTYYTKKVSF